MASAVSTTANAAIRGSARAGARDAGEAATAAWLCALPCAAIAAVAILVLGPPLARLLFPARVPFTFLPEVAVELHPEPTEHARYLIAICAPLLATLAIAAAPRWLPRVPRAAVRPLVVAAQAALVAVVLASVLEQYALRFGRIYTDSDEVLTMRYFTPATFLAAGALSAAALLVLRRAELRERAAALLRRESARRALLLGALALAATALCLLYTIHTDLDVGDATRAVRYHLSFTLDETFAVLDGRTPLVNFTAQYSSLLPFAIAAVLAAVGKTLLAFTLTVGTLAALSLLAIYGVLRRVTRSAAAALLLYLPFLATSLFLTGGNPGNPAGVGSYYGTMPLRYGLPYVLAWLTARRISASRDGWVGAWLLFTFAGVATLNNTDFGIAALGGTIAALLWAPARPLDRAVVARLALAVAAGLATALALVSALTLLRTGSLPQLERLVDYARIYAIGGFAMMPIPAVLGIHLLVYLTYVAAIALATVRAVRGAANRPLTGMLAWAGVFGLGAGAYYVGRSHPNTLKHEFSAWALALALLTVAAARELSAPRLRSTAIGALVALLGFGVMACSLPQIPSPWSQVQRLQAGFAATDEEPDPDPLAPPADAGTRRFVAALADGPDRFVLKRGAPVAILLTTGHRVADAYGVVNVSPYTGMESLFTVQRVDDVVDALRRAGGNTVIVPDPFISSVLAVLQRRGFRVLTAHGLSDYVPGRTAATEVAWPGGQSIMKWVDTRDLRAPALRR